MTPLVAVVAPRTGKIIKNDFERGEDILQNSSVNRQKSHWKVRFKQTKTDFSERGLALLKGLKKFKFLLISRVTDTIKVG